MSGKVHPLFNKSRLRELGIIEMFGGEEIVTHYHVAEIHKINDFSYRPLTKNEQDHVRVTLADCMNNFQNKFNKYLHVVAYEGDIYEILVSHNSDAMKFVIYYSVDNAVLVVEHFTSPHNIEQIALYDVILDMYTFEYNLDFVVRDSFNFIEKVLRESGYIE